MHLFYFTISLVSAMFASTVYADVQIENIELVGEAEHCVLLNVQTNYSQPYYDEMPQLRVYGLKDEIRGTATTYRPQAYVLPGRREVVTLVKIMLDQADERYSGIHVGAYRTDTEAMLASKRFEFDKDWKTANYFKDREKSIGDVLEIKPVYGSNNLLVLDVLYEYHGGAICNVALGANAVVRDIKLAKIAHRPGVIYPGRRWSRVEFTATDVKEITEIENISLFIYEFFPAHVEVVRRTFRLDKPWHIDPLAPKSEKDFCESWQKD